MNAKYKLTSASKDARVKSYRFSTDSKDSEEVLTLRLQIKRRNAEIREYNKRIAAYIAAGVTKKTKILGTWVEVPYCYEDILDTYRVRVMGRGPRAAIKQRARELGYICDVNLYLPQELAEYFDVYVGHNDGVEADKYARAHGHSGTFDGNKSIYNYWDSKSYYWQ